MNKSFIEKNNTSIKHFTNNENKLEILKSLKLIGKKSKKVKTFYYKGYFTEQNIKCDIVGYIIKINNKLDDYITLIIDINTDNYLKISIPYLKQMQSKNFNKNEIDINSSEFNQIECIDLYHI